MRIRDQDGRDPATNDLGNGSRTGPRENQIRSRKNGVHFVGEGNEATRYRLPDGAIELNDTGTFLVHSGQAISRDSFLGQFLDVLLYPTVQGGGSLTASENNEETVSLGNPQLLASPFTRNPAKLLTKRIAGVMNNLGRNTLQVAFPRVGKPGWNAWPKSEPLCPPPGLLRE